jgi:GNAT superfamily N-acetyltransferase
MAETAVYRRLSVRAMSDLRVLRFRRDVATEFAPAAGPWHVRRLLPAADAAAVAALVAAVGADGDPRLRAAGILDDLRDRPGRRVLAWLAEGPGAAGPVGLAALVAAGARHSLAWLLVAPADRRRGVARALVGTALAAAREAGAREVWVETHARWAAAVATWNALGFDPA